MQEEEETKEEEMEEAREGAVGEEGATEEAMARIRVDEEEPNNLNRITLICPRK